MILFQDVGISKDARRVKTSFESINSTEAEEHNSFDHSKASMTTCDYRTEREETFRELYLAWVPMPGTNIVTSRFFDKLKKKEQETSRKEYET